MSHRTADLPPLTGIAHVIRELRYHEVARQSLAVVLILLYTVTAAPIPVLAAIGLPIALARRVRTALRQRLHREEPGARDRRSLSLRPPPPLYGQHPARRGIRARRLALVGPAARAVLFLVLLPDGDRVRGSQAAPPLRRSVGELVRAHAGADAALRRRASRAAAGDRSWSFAVSNKRNGELVLIAFELGCAAWVAWVAFG